MHELLFDVEANIFSVVIDQHEKITRIEWCVQYRWQKYNNCNQQINSHVYIRHVLFSSLVSSTPQSLSPSHCHDCGMHRPVVLHLMWSLWHGWLRQSSGSSEPSSQSFSLSHRHTYGMQLREPLHMNWLERQVGFPERFFYDLYYLIGKWSTPQIERVYTLTRQPIGGVSSS